MHLILLAALRGAISFHALRALLPGRVGFEYLDSFLPLTPFCAQPCLFVGDLADFGCVSIIGRRQGQFETGAGMNASSWSS